MFAGYNQWANALLYKAAGELSEKELNRDTGAFFHSLFGTLTHLVVADQIWLYRLTGTGPSHAQLAARPFATLSELHAARKETDQRLIDFCAALTPEKTAGMLSYTRVSAPEPVHQPMGEALAHMFNHQTHHRGQAHMILTVLGKPSLEMDLIFYQRRPRQA